MFVKSTKLFVDSILYNFFVILAILVYFRSAKTKQICKFINIFKLCESPGSGVCGGKGVIQHSRWWKSSQYSGHEGALVLAAWQWFIRKCNGYIAGRWHGPICRWQDSHNGLSDTGANRSITRPKRPTTLK